MTKTITRACNGEEVEKKLNECPRKRHGSLSHDAVFGKITGLDAGNFIQNAE